MLPYWPSVTPLIPTTAWAIIPSAGERRGRLGIAGTSYSRRAKAAASCTDRWGRLPTPVAAPARRLSSSGGTEATTVVVTARPPSSSSRADHPLPVTARSTARAPQSTDRIRGRACEVAGTASASLHACEIDRWSPSVTTWGARLAWLAVAVIGGRAIGEATAGPERSGADRGDGRRLVRLGGRGDRPRRSGGRHAHRRTRHRPRGDRGDRGLPGVRRRPWRRPRPRCPGASRRGARRCGRDRLGLRPGVGVRGRAAVVAAPPARLPGGERGLVDGVGDRPADRRGSPGRRGRGCSPARRRSWRSRRAGCSPAAGISSAGAGW